MTMHTRQILLALLATAALVAACTSDEDGDAAPTGDELELAGSLDVTVADADRCDPIAPMGCLYPFPNDHFTVADDSTPTGRRVALVQASMPANASGVHIDPSTWNELDGFSPGAAILFQIPDLDLEASGTAPITDIGASLEDASAVVVLDADTGERLPHWVEADSYAEGTDEVPTTFVRPAVSLPEGHRIVVGVRGLVDAGGDAVEPTDAFRALRDRLETEVPELEDRRSSMEVVFADLEAAGVERDDLQLAWDFTVASTEGLSARLLSMRDSAFATLGDDAPAFTVDRVTPSDREGIETEVEGTYEVPLYLDGEGAPGSSLALGLDRVPTQTGTYTANFTCVVPESASATDPAGTGIYAHGLLGTSGQVPGGSGAVAAQGNIVFCGTDLIGMAEEDTGNAVVIAGDLSTFHTLSDRLLQGHLNTLFLGRLLIHPEGLGTDPAFQDGGTSLLTDDLVYYGISQGGIMGGATTAIAQDFTRAVLDVPGANYGLLLDRSVDFDPFRAVMEPAYPSAADRALGLQLIQMHWDSGEANGYLQHLIEDPYPDTPEHEVLLHVALGDHQVANIATEVQARTLGIPVHRPVMDDGRSTAVDPWFGIDTLEYPYEGSAVLMWDSGAELPPDTNQPARAGADPHSDPRNTPASIDQIVAFLTTGEVIDVCDDAPCVAVPDD
jgi:hypothetical protein